VLPVPQIAAKIYSILTVTCNIREPPGLFRSLQSIINLQECRLRQACWPSVTGYSFVQTSKIFECC